MTTRTEYADQRAHDVNWMGAEERNKTGESGEQLTLDLEYEEDD